MLSEERLSIKMISAKGRKLLADMGLELNVAAMETDLIIKEVTGYDRLHIMLNLEELVEKPESDRIMELLRLRSTKMPMAYVLGHREFMGLDFYCEKGVLIPRPDTEVLVETVMEQLTHGKNIYGIEIGVGTGIISLSLLAHFPELSMIAGDINEKAIELARKNAQYVDEQNSDAEKYCPVSRRFSVLYSDIFRNIEPLKLYDSQNHENLYDFIVSNPPYIQTQVIATLMSDVRDFEPHNALDGFEDGLYFYQKIVEEGYDLIKPGGFIAFEIGYDQGESVSVLLKKKGYKDVEVRRDLAGHDRVVCGFK